MAYNLRYNQGHDVFSLSPSFDELWRVARGSDTTNSFGGDLNSTGDYFTIRRSDTEYYVIKLDRDGSLYSTPFPFLTGETTIRHLYSDDQSNLYVCGNTTLYKYNASMSLQWSKVSPGTGNQFAFVSSVDENKFVFLASSDGYVSKFASDGTLAWEVGLADSNARDIKGYMGGCLLLRFDGVHRLDADGNVSWTHYVVGESPVLLCVLPDGSCVFTSGSTTPSNRKIKKLDSNGDFVWEYVTEDFSPTQVAVDPDENVYFSTDDEIIKLSSSGTFVDSAIITGQPQRLRVEPGDYNASPDAWFVETPTDLTLSPTGSDVLASWTSPESEFILERERWDGTSPPPI